MKMIPYFCLVIVPVFLTGCESQHSELASSESEQSAEAERKDVDIDRVIDFIQSALTTGDAFVTEPNARDILVSKLEAMPGAYSEFDGKDGVAVNISSDGHVTLTVLETGFSPQIEFRRISFPVRSINDIEIQSRRIEFKVPENEATLFVARVFEEESGPQYSTRGKFYYDDLRLVIPSGVDNEFLAAAFSELRPFFDLPPWERSSRSGVTKP